MLLTMLTRKSIASFERELSHGYWVTAPRSEASVSDFSPSNGTLPPSFPWPLPFHPPAHAHTNPGAVFDGNMPPKLGRLSRSVDQESAKLWTSQALAA